MFCPNCGNNVDNTIEVCPNCSFDFNTTLCCPYLLSNRCIFTSEKCKNIGLEYEDCQTYLHKSGISN